jgi:hypothetical protein
MSAHKSIAKQKFPVNCATVESTRGEDTVLKKSGDSTSL